MRPIRLEMSAFGPYSGKEIIDFEELNDRNLFLITGPTGSGKTTIFDAISFALYGETSGSQRTAEGLRSHFSQSDVLTQVLLKFELKGVIYEVTRVPKQMRPKAKTEGFTEQKPTATLMIEDGDPRTVITGVGNVTNRLEEVIGINVEQFKQIMMIPQGEFKKLLTSDSQEREKVLQQLFDTTVYRKIQFELSEQAKMLGSDIKSKKVERDTLTTKIKCYEEHELSQLITAEDKAINIIIAKTEELIKEDKKDKKVLEKKTSDLDGQIEKEIKNKEIAIKDNTNLKELVSVSKAYEEKLALKIVMEENQVQIEKAEKALVLTSEENNIIQREKELSATILEMQTNERLLTNTKKQLVISKKAYDAETSLESEKQRMDISINLEKVKGYEPKVKDINIIETSIKDLNKTLDLNKVKSVENQKGLEKTQTSINQCKKDMDESKDAELNLEKKTTELTNENNYNNILVELITKLDIVKKLKEDVHQSGIKKQKQEAKVVTTEMEYKKCKLNFFVNQAALIAKDLEENSPCPVCGSVDHPKLAVESGESVSEEGLELQEKLLEGVKAELTEIGHQHGILQERLTNAISSFVMQLKTISTEIAREISEKSDEDKRLRLNQEKETSEFKINELRSRINSLKESVKAYQNLKVKLEQLAVKQEKLESEIKELDIKISQFNKDLAVKNTQLQHVFDEVPVNLRTVDLLAATITKLSTKLLKAQESLSKIKESYNKTNGQYIELISKSEQYSKAIAHDEKLIHLLKETFEENVIKAKFTSLDNYQESKFSEDEISQLKKDQDDYKLVCETLKNKLAELQKLTKDKKTIDIESFDTMIEDLKTNRAELISVTGRLTSRIDDNRLTIHTIIQINKQIGTKEEKYKVIGQLSNISNGRNKAMITFERYVLAAFLEDILKAANIRLKQMTQSRYTLHRTDELSRKNKQSGLELEVFDTYTGKSRHVKTLSGGEGFKASLSMALGLSDVVQSYAGGVRLDTMFIDEGFGSLDQESLDSAINCLIDIQKSGRLVGIISHVQELKERIDTRLEIVTSNIGSESRFVIG